METGCRKQCPTRGERRQLLAVEGSCSGLAGERTVAANLPGK
jgi:hypothetical protein